MIHKLDLTKPDPYNAESPPGFLTKGRFDISRILGILKKPKKKLLVIDAPVGVGKSSCVFNHIAENPDSTCLVISHRRLLASTIARVTQLGQFGQEYHLHFRDYRDLNKKSPDTEYRRLSTCINSLQKLFKSNHQPKIQYDYVIIDECYSTLKHLTGATFTGSKAMTTINNLRKLCTQAKFVIAMQHEVPPIAVDILQNLGGIPREKTYVARATGPVSLMPAILVEAPSATFATAGLQLAMTAITQLYWDAVIKKKKKLYVPVCVKAHAYLMGMAIKSALLKWKDDGFISSADYQHYARRVKVAVYVPAKIAEYATERDWLHRFNSDPKNNSEDVDVLISTSVIQSELSLPAEFQYMMAIISRQPLSRRHHIQAVSRLRTNNRQFNGQRAIVIVEKGVAGGRDFNLYRRGAGTDRTTISLSDNSVDILATLTWLKNAELADTASKTHWLMRQLYGPHRSFVQAMKPEQGQSRFVLTDSFLVRLLGYIHVRTIKYSMDDIKAYKRSSFLLSKRQVAEAKHRVFLHFEPPEGVDADVPPEISLPDKAQHLPPMAEDALEEAIDEDASEAIGEDTLEEAIGEAALEEAIDEDMWAQLSALNNNMFTDDSRLDSSSHDNAGETATTLGAGTPGVGRPGAQPKCVRTSRTGGSHANTGTSVLAYSTRLNSKQQTMISAEGPFAGSAPNSKRQWAVDAWFLSSPPESKCVTFKRFCALSPQDAFTKFFCVPASRSWSPTTVEQNMRSFNEMIPSDVPVRIYLDIDLDVGDAAPIEWDLAQWFSKTMYASFREWMMTILGDQYDDWVSRQTTHCGYFSGFQIIESCSAKKLSYHVVVTQLMVMDSLQAKCAALHYTSFLIGYLSRMRQEEMNYQMRELHAAALTAARSGNMVDLSVYSCLRQLRTLWSSKIKKLDRTCIYERQARLLSDTGLLIGSGWDSRPVVFGNSAGSMTPMDIWMSTLCVPVIPSDFHAWFDPTDLLQYTAMRPYSEGALPSIPAHYIRAVSTYEAANIPESWSTRQRQRQRQLQLRLGHIPPPAEVGGLVRPTDTSILNERYGISDLSTVHGLGQSPDPKTKCFFRDGEDYIVSHNNILVQCRNLEVGMEVYCPVCETQYYADRFSFSFPKAAVGTSSAVVTESTRLGQLSIKCFNTGECGKWTVIVDTVNYTTDLLDSLYNVVKVLKINLSLPDSYNAAALLGFLTKGRFDIARILGSLEAPKKKLMVINAPVGVGKSTCVFNHIAERPDSTCLVICHRRSLASTLSRIPLYGNFGREFHLDFRDYRSLDGNSPDTEYKRVSICINSLQKLFKSNHQPKVEYDYVIIDECYSTLEHLTGETFTGNEAKLALINLRKLCEKAKFVIAMQHDVPPLAVDILQNISGASRESTVVARVTDPVSLMPAILVEAPSATFASAGLQLAMTVITQLYWDAVIEKKKKLYVPVCVKTHGYLMGMAIWSALLRWKDGGFIPSEEYHRLASRVKVAVYVPDGISRYDAERDWLDRFNRDPKTNSEDIDVLISTSVIQSGLSLPEEFQYMMAIITRQPMSHRHHTQAISRLRTNNRQLGGQRAIIIVEKGVTGGRDVNLYQSGASTNTNSQSANPTDILAILTWFRNAELADTANRSHWLLRQLYGPDRSIVLATKPEGGGHFILSDAFLMRLVDDVHERAIKYTVQDMRAYRLSARKLADRRRADAEHRVFLEFGSHEGSGGGDNADENPLLHQFPILRQVGIPSVGWISDALQSLRSDHVDTARWDMSCLATATPWSIFSYKTVSLSSEKHRDALKLAVIIILWHRQREQYPIGRTEQELATLRELYQLAERTWTNAVGHSLPEVGGLFEVMPAANLIADTLIELGFVDREDSSLSPAFRYNAGDRRAQGPSSAFRLEPEYDEYRRSNLGNRDSFFRYYLMRGHPCLSKGSPADRDRFLAQREVAIRYLCNVDVNTHTWWRNYVPAKGRQKRTFTEREEGDDTPGTPVGPSLQDQQDQPEQGPPLDHLIKRWGDSTRSFTGLLNLRVVYTDDGWLVDPSQCVASIGYMFARLVGSRYALERVTSDVFYKACRTVATLVPLTCAIVADDEAARNGFDVNIIKKRGWSSVLTASWLAALYKAHHLSPLLRSWCASYASRDIQDIRNSADFNAEINSLSDFCGGRRTMVRRLRPLKLTDFRALPSIELVESRIRGENEAEERPHES